MINIRYAGIEDIEGMIDVNIKTWRTTYSGIINEDFLLEREKDRENRIIRSRNNFGRLMTDGRIIYNCVAVDNGNIIGIINYGKCREEDEFDLTNSAEIYAIYVLKEYQKEGIGKKLMNFAVKDLIKENYNNVLIWALKDNPSVEFYKRIGGDGRLTRNIEIGKQVLEEIGFIYDDMEKLLNNTKIY